MLFDICKNPFPDIRLAGLKLLDAVCQHRWGEEMVAGVAGTLIIFFSASRCIPHTAG